MAKVREESLEIAQLRRMLQSETEARKKAEKAVRRLSERRDSESRPPRRRSEQMALPLRSRFPIAEFAETRGRNIALPGSVDEIAQYIGRGNAVRISEAAPQSGSRECRRVLYVPKKMPTDHTIVHVIGLGAAQILSHSHGNCILELPSCYALRRAYAFTVARELQALGKSNAQIAADMNLVGKTVDRILAEADYWQARLVE